MSSTDAQVDKLRKSQLCEACKHLWKDSRCHLRSVWNLVWSLMHSNKWSSPLVGLDIHIHQGQSQLFKGVILHPDPLGTPTCPKEWVTRETSKQLYLGKLIFGNERAQNAKELRYDASVICVRTFCLPTTGDMNTRL